MNRVYITGVGCITPLGNDIAALWDSLIHGKCGIDFITKIDDPDLPVKIAAEVRNFQPEAYGIEKNMVRHNDTYALYPLPQQPKLWPTVG